MSSSSGLAVVAVYFACAMATTAAQAGAKDESAAEWLAPKWFNEWHDGLAAKGLNFSVTYIGDTITNVSGGTGRGAIHFGRFDFSVDADLEKLLGWTGGRFFANAFETYGRGLTRNYLHNLATISEIEALPEARLYNAYFEQSFYNNALSIRVGQQAADVEFFDSQTDDLFINGTFGWPAVKASNLPAGGPAPPIAVPGIRVKVALSDQITVFGAVFNGNAARPGDGDPQLRDSHGLAFRVNDPPWVIGQVRWDYNINFGGRPLAGNVTPGAWHHFGSFDDQRFTEQGCGKASRQFRRLRRYRADALPAGIGNAEGRVGVSARSDGIRADRLQPAGLQLDRPLSRRRHRLRRYGSRSPAGPVRDRGSLYVDFKRRPKSRSRHPILWRSAQPGAK
jgi:porin